MTNAILLSIGLCALAFAASGAAVEDSATPLPVILLTGFEPFGKSNFNTSWDIVSTFEGEIVGGAQIHCARLPVVYDAVAQPLSDALAKFAPAAVISFGEGTENIRIERVAANHYHFLRPPDNLGARPPRMVIIPAAAAAIETQLPVAKIAAALHARRFHVDLSNDAGGYLCNECFYRLLSESSAPHVRGFIHLPVVPPQSEHRRNRLREAVRAIIETVAAEVKSGTRQ